MEIVLQITCKEVLMERNNTAKRAIALACILVLCLTVFCPAPSYAASVTIGTLELSNTRDLSGKGYFWDASKHTLTLNNAKLSGRITLPDDGDVTIILKGENTLTLPASINNYPLFAYTSHDRDITIRGDGTGSLFIRGFVYLGMFNTLNIEDCILKIQSDVPTYYLEQNYSFYAHAFQVNITDSRLICSDGMYLGEDYLVDNSYLEIHHENLRRATCLNVFRDFNMINNSELHINMVNQDDYRAFRAEGSFYADASTVVDITTDGGNAISVRNDICLLSQRLHLSAPGGVIWRAPNSPMPESVILPADYEYEEDIFKITEIDYTAPSYTEKLERIKAGVEATTITLRSSRTSPSGNIRLDWKKSPGYRVDYYQVYRSTKRYSGYTTKPFFTTTFGLKNWYINSADLQSGTRYYYKVRGVRVIDGQTYYTQWSNKAWRIAK